MFFYDEGGFGAGKGISFNGVTCVREFRGEPVIEVSDQRRRKGPVCIQTAFFGLDGSEIVRHKYKV
jgi:hypothetical protein